MASTTAVIPTSSSVVESCVIASPLADVWHCIKLGKFDAFWSKLKKSEPVKGSSPEADVYKWTFKDGQELTVKQEEHSSINHYITYSVIEASPQLTYTSATSTIRCWPITCGGYHEGHTFVQWTGNFSSDADAGVIEDAKYKRREALADLSSKVHKK